MARGERNAGWSGFFLTFTVFAAILLLLAREGQGEAVSAGARQVLVIYEGLTCWAVPALFMAWGMAALEEGKPSLTGALAGLVLPAFCLLLFCFSLASCFLFCLGLCSRCSLSFSLTSRLFLSSNTLSL